MAQRLILELWEYLRDTWWPTAAVWTVPTGIVVTLTLLKIKRSRDASRLEAKRSKKRQACEAAINKMKARVREHAERPAAPEVERVCSLSLQQLISELSSGDLTASATLRAYQDKAIDAHSRTNCLVEPIQEAEQIAKKRDADTAKGPLHGVPISLKEYFGIKGYDSTLGIISRMDCPSEDDSVLVKVLKKQGAVPFVRTNLPHMGFSYTTWNPVFGDTCHPTDTSRGPGGSSGGEAALIASHASPLGFGSDVGGSIRNPAHFCGIAGLKPTSNRISTKGTFTIYGVESCMPIVLGPMARDVTSLVICMRALLHPYMFDLDRKVPPIAFRDDIYESRRPLKIGFHVYNGLFYAVPACQRAVLTARTLLEKAGHTVVDWELPLEVAQQASDLGIKNKVFFADTGSMMSDVMKGDKANKNISDFEYLSNLPMLARKLLAKVLSFVDPEMAKYVEFSLGVKDVKGWWELVDQVQAVRSTFERAWEEAGIDALICPAFACPAMPQHQMLPLRGEGSDLQVYNILDVPAGVVPVTQVTKDDVRSMSDYPQHNDAYQAIKKGMEGAEGLPVAVQVVTPRWQEELCLRVMSIIEQQQQQQYTDR